MNFLLHVLADNYSWHYNRTLDVYQKVNGRVFVYITPMLWGYAKVQLYLRGYNNMSVCRLELRAENPARYDDLYQLGEVWLQRYETGEEELMNDDIYSVNNPFGVWGWESVEKNYWIR